MNIVASIKRLFWISRPVSWVNTSFPFAAAYLVANDWHINIFFWVGMMFFLVPYNLAMYGINDVYDYESDVLNPRKNSIEGSIAEKDMHPIILLSCLLLSAPFLTYMILHGSALNGSILVLSLFFVIAYSVKGLRFKEKPVLDSFTSSVHFVSPMLYGLSFNAIGKYELFAVLAFTAWGMASHAFGAIQDIVPDRKASIASIATKLGAQKTFWFSFCAYALSVLTVTQIKEWRYASLLAASVLIYVFNIFPYRYVDDEKSSLTNAAWRRFIWINYFVGFIFTILLIFTKIKSN